MRCPACQVENSSDNSFCEACGASLMRPCQSCGHPNRASAKFCGNCGAALWASEPRALQQGSPFNLTPTHLAERILASRSDLEGERKQVTVLFADIKGSTELIEGLDAEQAAERLRPALKAMVGAVHRYEGTVNKVQGDGIMALFGAPLAHEDHAVRACYAALALQQAIKTCAEKTLHAHGYEVRARVGLNSGEVIVGAIGNDLSMEYDAIGPTVHLASRMEQLAAPGSVRLTEATYRLAEGMVEATSLGRVPVKGITEPVEVHELIGATVRTRLQAASMRGLTRFIGRDSELLMLRKAAEQATKDKGQIIAVVGEPGVGKSRLLHEFAQAQRGQGWSVLEGRSLSYGRATAWLPVLELLRAYFRLDPRDDQRRIREQITGKTLALDDSLKSLLPALLWLFDLSVEDAAWGSLDAAQRRRRALEAVKVLLLRESEQQPLIVIFEDLHWADAETLALLGALIDGLPAQRLLLLVNYRPEFKHDWSSRTGYAQIRVDPLPTTGAGELVDALLGDSPELMLLKARLVKQARGNPLFIEEIVRALAETGALAGTAGAYRLTHDIAAIEVPATIQAIIAARVDRLAPATKRLLQSAAAIGHDVAHPVLQAVADLPEEPMRRALSDLQAGEFLYETRLFPDLEYAFKHAFTHEVAYAGLLRDRRQELHRRIGEAIEALYPDSHVGLAESLAEHFEKGQDWGKAASHYLCAADKAKDQYAYGRGSELCHRALKCLSHADGREQENRRCHVLLGDLLSLMGELDQANQNYERALALTTVEEARRPIANKLHRLGIVVRDGGSIAYSEHGSAEDLIVVVIPLGYDACLFQPMVEMLCQDFRIVIIDPRGTGNSDPAPWPYRLEQHLEDTRAVIESLRGKRSFGIGISYGGNLLVRLVHSYPQLLDKVVLVGTGLGDLAIGTPFERAEGWGAETMRQLEREGAESVAKSLAYNVLSEPGTEDLAQAIIQYRSRADRDALLNLIDPGPGIEIGPVLGEIKVPTLVAFGTRDCYYSADEFRYLARKIPGALCHAFEGRGHLPYITATSEFCGVIREFVRTGALAQ
jgi:class 3 adenylate cyclase/pimeloyl-ACP methyl ester carboxylesterase/tetratricopeptide (TPR) repeat protein